MSSLTFGSVGDIIAICESIQQLVQSLSDTCGFAPEYQGLDGELTAIAELLLQIQSLGRSHQENADLKGLNKEIESCRRTLDGVRVKVSKYAASLSGKGSGNALRDTFRKLKWQNQSDRLVEARTLVNGHYIRLQLQLSALGINLASFNAKSLAARFDKNESMLFQITDAVEANKQLSDSDTKVGGGRVGGMLVSGYIRSTINAVQSVMASLSPGPICAVSVDAKFEEAASQCRKLCAAIHEQCQRNNTYHRDIDFEVQLDLLDGRRMCLDGLDLPGAYDEPLDPKSVKRVRDIFKNPKFSIAEATADDVCPGRPDALWFQAGLTTALNKPELVKKLCVSSYPDSGVYGFVFNRDSDWIYSIVDDHLYLKAQSFEDADKTTTDAIIAASRKDMDMQEWYHMMYHTGSRALYFSQSRDTDETWLPLFEKAYAKVLGDYDALRWGYPGEALEDITGGVSTQLYTRDIMDKDRFWREELVQINTEVLFSVRTSEYGGYYGTINAPTGTPIIRIYEGNGQRLLLLRSLQSETDVEWAGAWCNRSPEWDQEWMKRLNHSFATKNVFWISYDDLLLKYMYLDRTRIFGPEWKIAQIWAALDMSHCRIILHEHLLKLEPRLLMMTIPRPHFRFYFAPRGLGGYLPKSIFLQLDGRYYNGLSGGYYFQLHFHLFKEGEDDYIIHSRGKYMASRSISVETRLGPGKYTVRPLISASRHPQSLPLAEVIKRNSAHKQSKLMQLGARYDVAHAKGLGFAALRTKHAQREQGDAETKQRAEKKKAKEEGNKVEDKSEDDGDYNPEEWNAICVAGLKVYSHDPDLQLELRRYAALDLKANTKSV